MEGSASWRPIVLRTLFVLALVLLFAAVFWAGWLGAENWGRISV